MQGWIDYVGRDRIYGWIQDLDDPNAGVTLAISTPDRYLGTVVANSWRQDLETNGIGTGRHAFFLEFDPPLPRTAQTIEIREEGKDALLLGSPFRLDPAAAFDDGFRTLVRATMDAALADGDLRECGTFLAEELARLLDRRSARLTRRSERLAVQQFRHRWKLQDAPKQDTLLPRALIIDTTLPDPGRDAGSGAVLDHARSLQRLGFEVVLAVSDMAPPESPQALTAIEAIGIAVCCRPWYGSVEDLLRQQSGMFDLVYIHRGGNAFAYLPLIRRHNPRARVVYCVADLHFLRLVRQAEAEQRPELARHAAHIRMQELFCAAESDAVITHSPVEAQMLREAVPAARVHVIPWSRTARPGTAPFAARHGIGFVGHFPHAPNLDAALFLADDIFPLVRAADPSITLRLVGSGMPDILRMPRDGVEPLGQLPDLTPFYEGLRLTVAPLLYGAGIKGKVLDSLAAGVPCVCSPIAAEGIDLGPALTSLIAADAPGLAASILRLHQDPALHAICVAEGLELIRTQFAAERVDALMEEAVQAIRAPRRQP